MSQTIQEYNQNLDKNDQEISNILYTLITTNLPKAESKIWHGSPVWFLNQNPVVGYAKIKAGIQLLFWSGQGFEEDDLQPIGKFKASQKVYSLAVEINSKDIQKWLKKAEQIQWDYKDIVKNKGALNRLT